MFPQYLALGMSAAEFWEQDPWLAAAYRRAHEIKRQHQSNEAWLQGLYVFSAISTALSNSFRKKGAKPESYLAEPIRVLPETEDERNEKAERERLKVIAALDRFEKNFNRKG